MTDNPFDLDYREPAQPDIYDTFDRERLPEQNAAPRPANVGKVTRLPSAEYHADPAPEPSLSATLAKLIISRSPRHAWMASPSLNPDRKPIHKKTFDIGRAAHRAILGCGDDYVMIPDDILASNGAASTKEAKAFIADARERDLTPLKGDEIAQVEAMREIAHARLTEHGVALDPARSELCAIAQIEGVWCRAMFDNVPEDPRLPIYDFKTCEDASPDACMRAILNYGYDIQAEHYRAVWKAATGEDRNFVFIFQEKPEPNEVTLIRLSGSFEAMAKRRAARARRVWGECSASGNWPGYPIGLHEVDAPAWLVEREFQEEM
ncbi:PD-(D/E)XK nuclease-like domain-containing protein [Sphingobium sp. CFD-1]|uniref:PD-(D/E)XK nuclease-like domain-containing protein n=1 Tax=Sphingobium sp. CFD-1 TaxID=2878545 RepID=UPI00214AB9CE|nr:PD-(D/E)XK nuclease-like domain-containing protein [Sphingobium sp. CFD-1]